MTTKGATSDSEVGKEQAPSVHLDRLRVTIWASEMAVREIAAEGLALRADPEFDGWADGGPAGRWKTILTGPAGLRLLVSTSGDFCQVELTGECCAFYGDELIVAFLAGLDSATRDRRIQRWRCSRVDIAFDGHGISPQLVKKWVDSGQFITRTKRPKAADYWTNEEGQTCYFPSLNRNLQRLLRCYNRRGYNRLEVELKGAYAHDVGECLADEGLGVLADLGLRRIVGLVDFVDVAADSNVSRCPRLPEWEVFVGDAKPFRTTTSRPTTKASAVGEVEVVLNMARRKLSALHHVGGDDLLLHVVRRVAVSKPPSTSELVFIERLRPFAYQLREGTCWTSPAGADDVPF